MLEFIGGRGRNRTYNLSVKSGIVKPGKLMISKENGGAKRTIWSLFGMQFGEVLLLRLNSGRTAFGAPDPAASGYLVVDRTVVCLTKHSRSSNAFSRHWVEEVNWRLAGLGFGKIQKLCQPKGNT